MAGYRDFDAERIKHMEMIQAVVTRLAGNSFLIKGWAITLTGALLGFALDRDDSDLAVAAFLPIVAFWGLDAYYLWAERLFRVLYDEVRKSAPAVEPFFMGATGKTFRSRDAARDVSWPRTLVRGTLIGFYTALIAATIAVIAVICTGSDTPEESEALLVRVARLADSVGHSF